MCPFRTAKYTTKIALFSKHSNSTGFTCFWSKTKKYSKTFLKKNCNKLNLWKISNSKVFCNFVAQSSSLLIISSSTIIKSICAKLVIICLTKNIICVITLIYSNKTNLVALLEKSTCEYKTKSRKSLNFVKLYIYITYILNIIL